MKKIIAITIFTFLLQFQANAQCDSVFITNIEIPQVESLNIIVSINNSSNTHYIYLNLILTDDLTGEIIAESGGGHLQLYPNQINTYEVDTTLIFDLWQLHYDLGDIPSVNNISVSFMGICDPIPWDNSVSINEIDTQNTNFVYPNPATNFLFIDSDKDIDFTILSSSGQAIIRSKSDLGKINIQNLSKGIYFLKLDGLFTYRFIKE